MFLHVLLTPFVVSCPKENIGCCTSVYVCAEDSLRVVHRPEATTNAPESLVVIGYQAPYPTYRTSANSTTFVIETQKLRATVDIHSGRVLFQDIITQATLLQEDETVFSQSKLVSSLQSGKQTWAQREDESIYGGGEYQNGLINWKDTPVDVVQFNTEAAVPFFVSTGGYSILWEGYSWTHMNDGQPLPLKKVSNNTFTTTITTKAKGKHHFLTTLGPNKWGAGGPTFFYSKLKVTIKGGGKTFVIQDWDGPVVMPSSVASRASLEAFVTYTITVETATKQPEPNPTMTFNPPNTGVFSLRAEAVAVVDYYFMYGKSIDGNIALYRDASGIAPLYPKKAYGFWQCRNHYETQDGLLENANKFRSLYIPVDNIIQDWMYWGSLGWGPHWDPNNYPNPKAMVEELHSLDYHFMASVWSRFDPKTSFYKDMLAAGHIINGSEYYDAFSAPAREMFYQFSKKNHFEIGVDSLWLDASEPENYPQIGQDLSIGPADQYFNPFSLMTTTAIAEGLRRDYRTAQGARVFSLTRSATPGQQRTGAVVWSGDTLSEFDELRRQLIASVNYPLCGIPYWTQDIGGFARPPDQYTNTTFHEMLIRWFQFGAFTPIMRVHGIGQTEPWNYGNSTMDIINSTALALRYRFMPYTYSGFREVEVSGSTMQRALVFDFQDDTETHYIGDQYMWGKSVMVAPVYVPGSLATREVYFPGLAWCDFYTGKTIRGKQWLNVTAPLEQIPLYLRAGSITVLGPVMQHALLPADPLEVRVCDGGGDTVFELYEDDGTTPTVDVTATQLVHIESSLINFSWEEATKTFTIAERKGSFPGMLHTRTINIYYTRPGHGVGVHSDATPDATVKYTGERQDVAL